MFCRYCGKELPDAAKFCRYCGKEIKLYSGARVDAVQSNAAPQQKTTGQKVASQPAVTQVAQGQPQTTSQLTNVQAQVAPQGTSAKVRSDDDGALDVYIDKLKEKLAKTENPLLKGRSLGNLIQAGCWALMVVSFFLPFVNVQELVVKGTTITEADTYSGIQFLSDMLTQGFTLDSDSEITTFVVGLFVGLVIMFFVMLFFVGKNIYQNKNTIKSNRNLIIWSCVDLAYQALIFRYIVFCNDNINKISILKSTHNPYDAGVAVYLMLLAAIVIIVVAACAIRELKEAQAGKTEDAEDALQNP